MLLILPCCVVLSLFAFDSVNKNKLICQDILLPLLLIYLAALLELVLQKVFNVGLLWLVT